MDNRFLLERHGSYITCEYAKKIIIIRIIIIKAAYALRIKGRILFLLLFVIFNSFTEV